MDPAFPDIVGAWAAEEARTALKPCECVNDNDDCVADAVSDPFLALVARAHVEATRIW
jgi:hypothetical protein